VGGRPAALGSAYAALANDGYAPVYNPAALGFLRSDELTGMHLAYLDSISDEYVSYVHAFSRSNAFGVALQYLLPGSINGTDANGHSIGSVDGHYAAYSLSYAHTFTDHWALGVTGKSITAAIGDASGSAFAGDVGAFYQANERLSLAVVAANMGGRLKLADQSDKLPAVVRLGAAYTPVRSWTLTVEGDDEITGLLSARGGIEWSPVTFLSLRAGYRTDTLKELSALAGLTTGLGFHLWGQGLDYAWVPLGDLGNTQYVSLTIRFGEGSIKSALKRIATKNVDDSEDMSELKGLGKDNKKSNDNKDEDDSPYQLIPRELRPKR
jgi:hypothetical protein